MLESKGKREKSVNLRTFLLRSGLMSPGAAEGKTSIRKDVKW